MKGKVIGIIPARFGSTRFPGKMLAHIAGKTLIQRTYENAKQCPLFSELWIATDDKRIFTHAEEFGAKVCMTPECPTGSDRLFAALQVIPHTIGDEDIVVNIQGDVPLLEIPVIEAVVHSLAIDPVEVMSTAVVPIKSELEALSPSVVKCVLSKTAHALYFSRTLIPTYGSPGYHAGKTYYHHLGLYAYRRRFLEHYVSIPQTPLQKAEDLEMLKVLECGFSIKVAIVESRAFGVDRPEDIEKVERLL